MKLPVMMVLFTMLASLGSGCIIRTTARGGGYRSCPPAHHWDGYACVHNGNGRGPVIRDHRR